MRSPLLALVPALALGASCAPGEPRPRNLLFLCVDTLRADQLGAWGMEPSITPTLDALASSGVVFESAWSHASWTLPSFASVLTSQYTSTHGCWTFETALAPAFTTLPELFQAAGFRTSGIASHVFFNERYGLQQGFDDFDDDLAFSRDEEGWVKVTSPRVTERAVAWLEERASQPDERWLLWLHYFDPHIPYVDHERGPGDAPREELERYRSEIAHTDRYLGEVLAALARTGFDESTVVAFLSDHGESFYEHPGVYRHARSLFREELQVPLILRVPGLPPRRVADPVRTVDLFPTLLELFGLRPASDLPLEGVSLVAALRGEPHASPPLLAEIDLHDDAFHRRAFLDGGWKLIEDEQGGFHLYELASDPEERVDLVRLRPERVHELRSRMEAALERARALGELYPAQGTIGHTAEELKRLHELGYGGAEDEDVDETPAGDPAVDR